MKTSNKIIGVLTFAVVGVGVVLAINSERWVNEKDLLFEKAEEIIEVDPVDAYFDKKEKDAIREIKIQIEDEKRLIKETLEFENKHVELQGEYYKLRGVYASSTQELIDRNDLINQFELQDAYAQLAEETGSKQIELINN